MEVWFVFALLSGIFGGMHNFCFKVSAARNYNGSKMAFYNMFIIAIISLFFICFDFEVVNLGVILFFSILYSVFAFFTIIMRVDAIKNIDATIYYPLYKVFSVLIVIVAGFIFFNDDISYKQMWSLIIGILIPLLLINNLEYKRQKNFNKGMLLLGLGTISAVLASMVNKFFAMQNLNIFYYMCIANFLGAYMSHFSSNKTKYKQYSDARIRIIGLLMGMFSFGAFYFFIKALSMGPFSIVYILNSFSTVIVVLLAVLFYKEHFDLKKASALTLSVVALFLLR